MEGVLIVLIGGIIVFSVIVILWGLRAERTFVRNKSDLVSLLESLYSGVEGSVKIVAGEANKAVYERICKLIEKAIDEGRISLLEIVVGPEISVYSRDLKLLDGDGRIKESVLNPHKIHPLFNLMKKYPDKVKIYYKTDASFLNVRHFAIVENGKKLLYVEKLHSPLQESEAVLIENPNPVLLRKYKKLFSKIINSGRVTPLQPEKLRIVRFSDFSSLKEKQAEQAA
jgi:hypothetical protein